MAKFEAYDGLGSMIALAKIIRMQDEKALETSPFG